MNKKYVIYDETGAIRSYGQCSPQCWPALQARHGKYIMLGEGKDTTHKVVDGNIVELPDSELPPAPPPSVCVIDPPANITKFQWQKVLSRLDKLEGV